MPFECEDEKRNNGTDHIFRRVSVFSPSGKVKERALHVGNFLLCHFEFGQDSIIERSKSQIDICNYDEFAIIYVNSGRLVVDISTYTFDVPRFHCYVHDLNVPSRARVAEDCDLTIVFFSRPWLASRVAGIHQAVARVIDATKGWGVPLNAIFSCLASDLPFESTVPGHVLMEHIASAFALAVGEREAMLAGARALTFRRLRRSILAEMHDLALTPAAFARRHGMSVRTLHALFAEAGTSFGETLMHFRLTKARRMLEDPRFDAMSIAEISFLTGFANASHFGRRFRQTFQCTPAVWRASRRTGAMSF